MALNLFLVSALILFLPLRAFSSDIQFKADYYTRDLRADVVRAKGHAWLTTNGREVWADELEIDFAGKLATANGNVHIREADIDIWCRHASYNLNGEDAVIEEASITAGQLVLTGTTIHRIDKNHYEIEEGTYTNCNVSLQKDKQVGLCTYDWKIYGRYLNVTLEQYAHVYDALLYVKKLPVFYSPYFVAPAKTQRQSGLLTPRFRYTENLGNGISLPYFLALGPWHDLTFTPSHYSKTGYHLGFNYRYLYSNPKQGNISFFLLQRRFSENPGDPAPDNKERGRSLGFVGEAAVNAHNIYRLGGRSHSRQTLRLVTNPYYTVDYASDLEVPADIASLRSQISVTHPTDDLLLTSEIQYHQSMIVSKDVGSDGGAVTKAPAISFSKMSTPFLSHLFSYEFDASLINFYRPGLGYDRVPALSSYDTLKSEKAHSDPDPSFHTGDYIRKGVRFQIEPRLVANVPMPPGFQFQPLFKAGSLLYHFDAPTSELVHREYAETELPVSLYLLKSFRTGIAGYEKISHVLQPRFIYANSLYQGATDHPFFSLPDGRSLSNPRFDIVDRITPYEYMRFELINRFRRKSGNEIERFFLIQVSEQYNLRTSDDDPRYARRLGPIELLAEFKIWRFTAQLQANYQLERTLNSAGEGVKENDWSSSIEYRSPYNDAVKLNNQFHIRADDSATVKMATLAWYKTLPTFFDVDGELEYSLKTGEPGAYRLGLLFSSKPLSCWSLTFSLGRNPFKQPFAVFTFRLNFGNPAADVRNI